MTYVFHNSVPYCHIYRTVVCNCDTLDFYQKMFVSTPSWAVCYPEAGLRVFYQSRCGIVSQLGHDYFLSYVFNFSLMNYPTVRRYVF